MSRSRAAGAKPKRRRKKDLTEAPKGASPVRTGRVRGPKGPVYFHSRLECPRCRQLFSINLAVGGGQCVVDVIDASWLAGTAVPANTTCAPTGTSRDPGTDITEIREAPGLFGVTARSEDDAQTTLFST